MKKIIAFSLLSTALVLVACSGEKKTEESTAAANHGVATGDMVIAYYVEDSIPEHFTYFMEAQAQIEKRAKEFEQKLMIIQQEGQRMLENYQRQVSAGLLSQNEIAKYEQQIANKQNQMQVLQETEGAEIDRDSYNGNMELMDKMSTYGKEYSEKHGITLLLAAKLGGQVLYADSTMDVTMDFIEYMNKREEEEDKDSE